MKITVKAACYLVHTYYSRTLLLRGLVKHLYEMKPTVARRALQALENPNDKYDGCIFDPLNPICSSQERRMLNACVTGSYRQRKLRSSLSFKVEPTLTIGGLKSLLKPLHWIPKDNLVLVQHKDRPLEDDSSTLDECGVKGSDSLLTCSDGSFALIIRNVTLREEFDIPVSSCFETVGDLKEKIGQKIFLPPELLSIYYQKKKLVTANTRLVALGIVRDMLEDSGSIELHISESLKNLELLN